MAGAMFSSTKSHAFMPVAHSEIGSHFVPSDAFTMRVFLVTSKLAPSGSSRRNFIMSFTCQGYVGVRLFWQERKAVETERTEPILKQ
jgi:hypothetical protein